MCSSRDADANTVEFTESEDNVYRRTVSNVIKLQNVNGGAVRTGFVNSFVLICIFTVNNFYSDCGAVDNAWRDIACRMEGNVAAWINLLSPDPFLTLPVAIKQKQNNATV